MGIKRKKTLQIPIWDLKDAEEQSCFASNMNNMENNWDAPWRPSYSLAVVGGLNAVDEVELEGWVPLNDHNLRFSPEEIARRILFFNTVARIACGLSVRMSNVGT